MKVQTHHHITTCRKKKGVACRFNASWGPSDKSRIVCSEQIDEAVVNQIKKLINKVLSYFVAISGQSDVTLSKFLEKCGVKAEQYHNALALGCVEKRYLYCINKNHLK